MCGSLMTARVVTVELDDRLEVVKKIFDTLNFHHLLVIDDSRKLKGIVSDRDLLKALSPYVGSAAENARDLATLNKRVHQIMSRNLITLQRQAPLSDGHASAISRAPDLLHSDRRSAISSPLGILSWRDVFKALRTIQLQNRPPG